MGYPEAGPAHLRVTVTLQSMYTQPIQSEWGPGGVQFVALSRNHTTFVLVTKTSLAKTWPHTWVAFRENGMCCAGRAAGGRVK